MTQYLLLLLLLALCATGCGADTPSAPTPPPPPPANLVSTGSLTVTACFSTGRNFDCIYTGTVVNQGAGCAMNVRGSTLSYDSTGAQLGSAQWSYLSHVASGERFVYSGFSLLVPSGTWSYNTQVAWDTVRCP